MVMNCFMVWWLLFRLFPFSTTGNAFDRYDERSFTMGMFNRYFNYVNCRADQTSQAETLR
jgi:hypothetical protein